MRFAKCLHLWSYYTRHFAQELLPGKARKRLMLTYLRPGQHSDVNGQLCTRPYLFLNSDLVPIISLYLCLNGFVKSIISYHTNELSKQLKLIDETVNQINHLTFPAQLALIKTYLICCIYIYPRLFLTPGKSDVSV